MDVDFCGKFAALLSECMLSDPEKEIIKCRYLAMVANVEREYYWVHFFYILLNNMITIAGVLVASLAALDVDNTSGAATGIQYTVVALGVVLTLCSKFIHLFNVDKKHVLTLAVLEKLYSEGWTFLAGVGIYNNPACEDMTHRFKLFCSRIELIKVKSVGSSPEMQGNSSATEMLATSPRGTSRRGSNASTASGAPRHVAIEVQN